MIHHLIHSIFHGHLVERVLIPQYSLPPSPTDFRSSYSFLTTPITTKSWVLHPTHSSANPIFAFRRRNPQLYWHHRDDSSPWPLTTAIIPTSYRMMVDDQLCVLLHLIHSIVSTDRASTPTGHQAPRALIHNNLPLSCFVFSIWGSLLLYAISHLALAIFRFHVYVTRLLRIFSLPLGLQSFHGG